MVFKNSEPDSTRRDNKVGKDQLRTTPKEHQRSKTRSYDKPTIFLQYRGNLTQHFASKLKELCEMQVLFT